MLCLKKLKQGGSWVQCQCLWPDVAAVEGLYYTIEELLCMADIEFLANENRSDNWFNNVGKYLYIPLIGRHEGRRGILALGGPSSNQNWVGNRFSDRARLYSWSRSPRNFFTYVPMAALSLLSDDCTCSNNPVVTQRAARDVFDTIADYDSKWEHVRVELLKRTFNSDSPPGDMAGYFSKR